VRRSYVERDIANHRAGVLAAVLGNIHRDEKRRPAPFTSDDFFPPSTPLPDMIPVRQSTEEQIRYVEMLNVALGGKDRRKRKRPKDHAA
jgi:hypothetical protein